MEDKENYTYWIYLLLNMEWSKIPMLQRFDTISHVMPYYGHTHKAFLLLSSLCSASRCKLDEYYKEFVHWMSKNWIKIVAILDIKCLILPSDLFIMDALEIQENNFDKFVQFILNLYDFKGCYFNDNFMHSQIKINDYIKAYLPSFEELNQYVDILKSIQVRLRKNLYKPISLNTIIIILNLKQLLMIF